MNSSNILIGPGYLTFNSASFRFGDGGVRVKFIKKMREVSAEEFGRFDSVQTDRMIEVTGRLWSGYENLPSLFPATMLTPVIGSPLFGVSDKPLVINGQDGSRFTAPRAMITAFTNLSLGVEKDLFSADVKWTCLLASGSTPTTAGAYYTDGGTGNSYAAPSFDKTKFKAPVLATSWGARSGFTSMAWRKGLEIAGKYDLDFEPCYVDGFGTMDAIVTGFEATAKGNPIGPTFAQVLSNMGMAGALGALESTANSDDLVITSTGIAITLYAAFIEQNEGFAWSRKNNRVGDLTWKTTVPFSAGAPTTRTAIG
jgi:hypothetical protein